MPVPTSISDLSTNPTSNSPQGSESAKGTIDDYLRTLSAFIAQDHALIAGGTVSLASAGTVAIGAAASINVSITGTTNISAFDTVAEGVLRWVTFTGSLILVHSGNLQLPGFSNIATGAGDTALFRSLGGGAWKCTSFQHVSGVGIVPATSSTNGYLTADDWNRFNSKQAAGVCLPLAGGTMTGQLLLKEGSAGAPGLSFANDGAPDTGLYHIGDGAFGISCNSTPVASFNGGGMSLPGTISAGTVTQTSDERKKKHWQRLPGDFIAKLAGMRKSGLFQWKKGGGQSLGVGAQSLEQILPLAVHTDEAGAKTVNYGAAAMVSAVELARAMVDVQARLAKLEAQ